MIFLRMLLLFSLLINTVLVVAAPVTLQMYYPVNVTGKLSQTIESLVSDFQQQYPDIQVKPIYTGDYVSTVTKVLTAYRSGNAPQLAVIGDIEIYSLQNAGAVIPISDLVHDQQSQQWLDSFYPSLIRRVEGKIWSIPFQRSTAVLYWNKQAFAAAGLDAPPETWQQVVEFGQKLVKRTGNEVTQWGIEIPSTPNGYWVFQNISSTNGGQLDNNKGNAVTFNDTANVQTLQWFTDLAHKYMVSPTGAINWSTSPQDFINGKTAMLVTSTGSLTNILQNAKFPVGVAMLPANKARGSATGGGNLYLLKGATEQQQQAALTFIRWLSAPEQSARWSIATGYIATSPAAWQTPAMQQYVNEVPQSLVAREQLAYAQPELSTWHSVQIQELLNKAIEAAVTRTKTPQQALDDAQKQADRLLKRYQ